MDKLDGTELNGRRIKLFEDRRGRSRTKSRSRSLGRSHGKSPTKSRSRSRNRSNSLGKRSRSRSAVSRSGSTGRRSYSRSKSPRSRSGSLNDRTNRYEDRIKRNRRDSDWNINCWTLWLISGKRLVAYWTTMGPGIKIHLPYLQYAIQKN